MSHLVKNSGLLVLSVASAASRREAGEEQGAVDHLRGRRRSVSQNTTTAGAQDVGAVLAAVSRRDGAALSSDAVEDTLYGGGGARGGGLEVLVQLGGIVDGCRGCGAGERSTVVNGIHSGCALSAGTVGLDDRALGHLNVVAADPTSLGTVNVGRHLVGREGHRAGDGGGFNIGVGESTLSDDIEVTARAHIVSNGNVEGGFDGLTSLEDLESRLIKIGSADTETDAIKSDLVTSFEYLNLLNVRVVEECTSLEELEVGGARVPDGCSHSSVASELE